MCWDFKDKYRMRNFKKKNEDVDDGDIMYRVGEAQKFMEYHIRRLRSCADKVRHTLQKRVATIYGG